MAVLCKRVQATSKATAAMQSQWCCYWPSDCIVGMVAMDCETRSRQWDEDLLCLQQWCRRLVMMVIGDIDLLQVLSGGVVCLMSLQHLATGYWLIFFFFCVDQVRLIGYDLFFVGGGGVFVGWWQGGWRWWRWMGFRLWWFLFGLGIQIENDGSEEFCFVCDLRDCFKSTESCLWYQIWHRATKTIFPGK